MTLLKAYLGTSVSFFMIDIAWINLFVRPFYDERLGHLLRESPSLLAVGGFYVAFAGGIVFLAVRPALASGSWMTAAINGGVLGALAYGTFTVTNYVVLEDWTGGLVVSDIAWGVFLTALAASCGYLAARL